MKLVDNTVRYWARGVIYLRTGDVVDSVYRLKLDKGLPKTFIIFLRFILSPAILVGRKQVTQFPSQ